MELLVVFVGVYAAFLFDGIRERKAERANQATYFHAFLMELENLQADTERLKHQMDSTMERHRSDPASPLNFEHNIDFTNSIYIVESAFYNDRFTGIHPEFMMNLEFGANQIKRLDKRFDELRNEIRAAKFAGIEDSPVFRTWLLGELEYLSARLNRLIITIEKGAVPETRAIISRLAG